MNITEFLRTGEYLTLKVGSPERDLYSIFPKKELGKKHYHSSADKEEGFSYFYNALEIMIIDSKIYSIGVDLERCPVTMLNNVFMDKGTSFELILRYLDLAEIKWFFEAKYCNDRKITVKTEGNVIFGCVYEKGNYWLSKFKVYEKG